MSLLTTVRRLHDDGIKFILSECKFNKAKANDVDDRMLPSQRRCVTAVKRIRRTASLPPPPPRLLTIFTSFSTRLFSP